MGGGVSRSEPWTLVSHPALDGGRLLLLNRPVKGRPSRACSLPWSRGALAALATGDPDAWRTGTELLAELARPGATAAGGQRAAQTRRA